MSISYRIYWNAGSGGPVDRSSPYLTASALSADTPALAAPGDYTFLVASRDDATGLEDRTADARVRVVVGPGGSDDTGLPPAPSGLSARPRPGGAARLDWHFPVGSDAAGFHAYVWPAGSPPDYAAPAAAAGRRVPADPGRSFSCVVAGLTPGASYTAAVRAFNAAGEGPAASVTFPAPSAGPAPVASLTASATP